MVHSSGCMCALRLGSANDALPQSCDHTVHRQCYCKGKIQDPTTMLTHGVVRVEVARTIVCMEGISAWRTFISVKLLFPKAAGEEACSGRLRANRWGIQAEAAVTARCTDALWH